MIGLPQPPCPYIRGLLYMQEMVLLLRINRHIQAWDFGVLVPLLARLPLFWGRGLAQARGVVCAVLDYDWRSTAINARYVRSRVFTMMRQLSIRTPVRKTVQRFINNSLEEWQSCLFRHPKKMDRIARKCHIDHLETYQRLAGKNQGIVMVAHHFDSFCMGMVLMGMKNLKVHCINTRGIEDPRIDPEIRSYFQTKYRCMERWMNGKMPYYEDGMQIFYDKLQQGEMVVLMGDVPGRKSGVKIDFMGKKFRLPLGAWHMATKTDSLLGAYVTLGFSGGRYCTVCIPPYSPDPYDPEGSLMPIYEFLESWTRACPEKWVASDLLQAYES